MLISVTVLAWSLNFGSANCIIRSRNQQCKVRTVSPTAGNGGGKGARPTAARRGKGMPARDYLVQATEGTPNVTRPPVTQVDPRCPLQKRPETHFLGTVTHLVNIFKLGMCDSKASENFKSMGPETLNLNKKSNFVFGMTTVKIRTVFVKKAPQ